MTDYNNEINLNEGDLNVPVRVSRVAQGYTNTTPPERWLVCYHEYGRMQPENIVIEGDPVNWLVGYREMGRNIALVSCFQLAVSDVHFKHIQQVINGLK